MTLNPEVIDQVFQDKDGNPFLLDTTPDHSIMVFGCMERLKRFENAQMLRLKVVRPNNSSGRRPRELADHYLFFFE
jgi:hypothetical protein